MLRCISCDKQLQGNQKKYCSNQCQRDKDYEAYIGRWLAGAEHGERGVRTKNISRHIKRYLLEMRGEKCSLCGWAEINSFSGRIPIEIDHIDGNAMNNSEQNLQLLCPNCHSLTKNYRNLNKGNGRLWRRDKYVKIV